jgi:parvulin-like peptidyl-prolyl isomerase
MNHRMRVPIAFALAGLACLGAAAEEFVPEPKPAPAPKAVVINGEKLPDSVVAEFFERALLLYKAGGRAAEIDTSTRQMIFRQARAQAVQQVLLGQHVAKNKIAATPQAIQREIEQIRADMDIAGFSLDQMLKERGKTIEDFVREVAPTAALRQSCYNALDLAQLKKDFERKKGTQARRRASHILFMQSGSKDKKAPRRSPEEARRLALQALERVRNGEELGVIARECSDCPSASQGGDLGWFTPDKMVKPFSDAVYAMAKVGDISPVVESEFGFHVIKMTGLLSTDEEAWQARQREAAEALFQEIMKKIVKEAVLGEE